MFFRHPEWEPLEILKIMYLSKMTKNGNESSFWTSKIHYNIGLHFVFAIARNVHKISVWTYLCPLSFKAF